MSKIHPRLHVHPVGIPGKCLAIEIVGDENFPGPSPIPVTLTEEQVMELTDQMRRLVFDRRSARR
jgi:hypothetical protein